RLAADESDDWLLHVRLDISRRYFFRRAADFADHHNPVRIRIFIEHADRIDEVRSDNRIASNADARRLSDLPLRQLADRFVRQCSAARNDADVAFKMNM